LQQLAVCTKEENEPIFMGRFTCTGISSNAHKRSRN